MTPLAPNTDIKITAVGVDANGNDVDISTDELKLELVNVQGNVGTLNDSNDTLTTGADGTATVNASVTVDGKEFTASEDVEISGDGNGVDHIKLNFTPAA